MRSSSCFELLPKEGDEIRPSNWNKSEYIIRCIIDWLSSGSVPPMSAERSMRGRFADESSQVQCAVLGSGMFDYQSALTSSNEYTRMSAYVSKMGTPWEQQGALATIQTSASAPTLFTITRTIFMPTRTRTRRDSMPHRPS